MKTKILYTIMLVLMTSILAIPAQAARVATHAEQATTMLHRLETIKEMNLKNISTEQKNELKIEVQGIHQKLKSLDGGIYLSVGAIIIILLIILILF
jgi:hypothetical protein